MTTLDRTLATLLALSVLLFATREAQVLAQTHNRSPDIVVSVSGAVVRPGVLRLPAEARLVHAVEACGGLTTLADRETVELAKPLADGDHLVIASSHQPLAIDFATEAPMETPKPQESAAKPDQVGRTALQRPTTRSITVMERQSSSSVVVERQPRSTPRKRRSREESRARREATPREAVGVVDINTATLEELDRLPGVGPVLAQRIISAREAAPGATFSSLEELETIRGIKGKTLLRLRPHLKLEGS